MNEKRIHEVKNIRSTKAYLELFDAVFLPQIIEVTQKLDAFLADVNILVETFDEDPEGIGLESTILTTRASSLMGPQNCLLKTGHRNVIVNNFALDIIPDGPRPSQLLYLLCRAVADVIIICLIDL